MDRRPFPDTSRPTTADQQPDLRALEPRAHFAKTQDGFETLDTKVSQSHVPAAEKLAVALRYDPATMPAPQVVATGRGALAARIIAAAQEAGIPVREDPLLVATLASLDLEDYIPPDLYSIVAQLLAFLLRVEAAYPQEPERRADRSG